MKRALCLLIALLVMAAMVGCSSEPASSEADNEAVGEGQATVENDPEDPNEPDEPEEDGDSEAGQDAAESVLLTDWAGTWNNFMSYFDDAELDEAYEFLAEEEGNTPEEVKQRYLEGDTYQCEIAALGIQGDVITVYSATQTSAGSGDGIASQAAYTYQGEVEDANGRAWDCFTTEEDALYTVFLLLEAEADVPGETMMHFHFRYGNDVDELLARDGWYPTMTAYDSTHDLIVGHMIFDN